MKDNILYLEDYLKDGKFYYTIGQRYFNTGRLEHALIFLSRAAELEPYNADYKYNLACLMSEMKRTEHSNRLLLDILMNIDPGLTDCYFGIGCNYFEMGKLDKAKEYFEKYLHFDPSGPFAADVYDVLYYLNIYDDSNIYGKLRQKAVKASEKGLRLLNSEDNLKARQMLEKALEMYPGLIEPRFHLASIYYKEGQSDKAISMLKSILSLEPENVEAQCRLARCFSDSGRNEKYKNQIEFLSGYEPRNEQEYLLLKETLASLDEYSALGRLGEFSATIQPENEGQKKVRVLYPAAISLVSPQSWRKEWDKVINCAVKNRENIYTSGYRRELRSIWLEMESLRECDISTLGKQKLWAAVLEYIYCTMYMIGITKKKLADKYKISVASLTRGLKNIGYES